MHGTANNEAMEISNVRIRLRRGVRFELHDFGGQPSYIVRTKSGDGFYQIGIPEYAFISLLDGTQTIGQAIQATASRLGQDAFNLRNAIATCHWLLQNQLADSVDATRLPESSISCLIDRRREGFKAKRIAELNPMFVKLPLGNPDRILQTASKLFGWITSPFFSVIWSFVLLCAAVTLFQHAEEINQSFLSVLAPNAWVWLGLTFVGLKIVHELAHGIFCLRYGGNVTETGLVFILCIPIPYVDVTSCWAFPSKWQRIAVSSAGIYVELFIASLAAMGWVWTNDPVTRFHLFNVLLSASLTTVLFNANFLMRFDGYYILSDMISIPNLAQSGQQYVQFLGKKYLLGLNVKTPRYRIGDSIAIKAYGIAALCWRILICISLAILSMSLFYGFGILMMIVGIGVWLGVPLCKFVKMFLATHSNEKPKLGRLMCITIPGISVVCGILFWVPWPFELSAPGIVQFQEPASVRTDVDGFVDKVFVKSGQVVKVGDPLIRLKNQELVALQIQVESDLQISRIHGRQYHSDGNIAAWQAEVSAANSLEKQLNEIQSRQESLQINACINGVILGYDLESIQGQHLKRGQTVCQIVDPGRKEVAVSIQQEDAAIFSHQAGQNLEFTALNSSPVAGKLKIIKPKASQVIDVRLSTYAKGPLSVRPVSSNAQQSDQAHPVELVYPRFEGVLELENSSAKILHVGTVGWVGISKYPRSIAGYLIEETREWLLNHLQANAR
ncbi:MAG: efflux RND transporter periplasmic adaptor subunit [Planctomycetota bacterium]